MPIAVLTLAAIVVTIYALAIVAVFSEPVEEIAVDCPRCGRCMPCGRCVCEEPPC